MAIRLSAQLGLCSYEDADAVRDHLVEVGLPIAPPADFDFDIDTLMALMAQDKKAQAGKLTLILARGIGQAFISRDTAASDVRALWHECLLRA